MLSMGLPVEVEKHVVCVCLFLKKRKRKRKKRRRDWWKKEINVSGGILNEY